MAKVIGWFIGMTSLIAGFSMAKDYSETGNMTSLGVSILCFGCVFWLSKTTVTTSKKVMTATTIVLAATGLLSWLFLGDIVEVHTGMGVYFTWELCLLFIGLPIMAYIIKNDDH